MEILNNKSCVAGAAGVLLRSVGEECRSVPLRECPGLPAIPRDLRHQPPGPDLCRWVNTPSHQLSVGLDLSIMNYNFSSYDCAPAVSVSSGEMRSNPSSDLTQLDLRPLSSYFNLQREGPSRMTATLVTMRGLRVWLDSSLWPYCSSCHLQTIWKINEGGILLMKTITDCHFHAILASR